MQFSEGWAWTTEKLLDLVGILVTTLFIFS